MSTVGAGYVVAVPAAIVGAGVGMVALAAQGVMWCGKKLRENYLSACQSYTNQFQQALAEGRAQARDRQFALEAIIEQMTASPHLQAFATSTADAGTQQAMNEALRRAHAALDSAEQTARLRQEHEQERERRRQALARMADQALAASDTQFQRASQVQQAQYILAHVEKELQSMRLLLAQSYGQTDLRYQSDIENIERMMHEARQRLDASSSIGDPRRALSDAEAAQKAAERLKQQVSITLLGEWDERHKQAIVARARLEALQKMVEEAASAGALEARRGLALQAQIGAFEQRVEEAASQGGEVKSLLADLVPFAQWLMQEINERQQQRIADTIATTLSEMGFKGDLDAGTPPTVEMVGEEVSIRAKRAGSAEPGAPEQDEKLVVFYVDSEGKMNYDFSGYVGNECTYEAERIFAALRAKGLAVVDPAALPQIGNRPLQEVIQQLLHSDQFAPRFDVNSPQEHVRAALVKVLRDMGFNNIHEFGSSGTLVIDAYNGSLGYHTQTSPAGEARIIKNDIDVSHSPGDPLAEAAQKVQAQAEQERVEYVEHVEPEEQEDTSWLDYIDEDLENPQSY